MFATKQELTSATKRLRLTYLDGLRGLAALYVVLYHASDPSWAEGTLSHVVSLSTKLLVYGHFAVAVFIILSGYCLMLPILRSADHRLQGGLSAFIRRRARRIMPPYYAALALALLLIALVPQLHRPQGNYWDSTMPAFRIDVLISHLTLVQNLSPQWNFKIDPPLWSVATEWQIYFCFPLLLLPLWRRSGIAGPLVAGCVLGVAPHFLLPAPWNLDSAVPWYLALFALGMSAAAINFDSSARVAKWRANVRWGRVTLILLVTTICAAVGAAKWWWAHLWCADLQVGLVAASLLIYCTGQLQRHKSSRVLTLLEAPVVVKLGHMSYSLYLIHAPLLALLHIPLHNAPMSPDMRQIIMFCLNVPVTVALSYLFHLAFERRFMSNQRSTAPNAEASVPSGSHVHVG